MHRLWIYTFFLGEMRMTAYSDSMPLEKAINAPAPAYEVLKFLRDVPIIFGLSLNLEKIPGDSQGRKDKNG